jgi:hypothetical protein
MALCGKPTWKVFVEGCNRICFNEGVKKDNLDLSPSLDSTTTTNNGILMVTAGDETNVSKTRGGFAGMQLVC